MIAAVSAVAAERQPAHERSRLHAGNFLHPFDYLAVKIPLRSRLFVLGARQTIFQRQQSLGLETHVDSQQFVETSDQQTRRSPATASDSATWTTTKAPRTRFHREPSPLPRAPSLRNDCSSGLRKLQRRQQSK